jgi:hypothetical protein
MGATQGSANEADVNGPKMLSESRVRGNLHVVACYAVNACSKYDDENYDNCNATPDECGYGHDGYA